MTRRVFLAWALLLACYSAILIGYQRYPRAAFYAALSGAVISVAFSRDP